MGRAEPGAEPGIQPAILVVDDEPLVRLVCSRMLDPLGYAVTTAESGAAALHLIEQAARPFDVVLTDVMMPGLDGMALAERLLRENPSQRVVLMSGFLPPNLHSGAEYGARLPFLGKPFTADQLIETLRSLR